jgi:nucleoside-diphosphate-sugar epimerase
VKPSTKDKAQGTFQARVLFAAAQRPDLHGRRGFAAGDTVSMGDLVRTIAALRTPHARAVPLPDTAIRLLGLIGSMHGMISRTARPINRDKVREILQEDWLCDGEPLLRDLRITAGIPWREGLRDTCRWYVDARWLARQAFASV